MSPVARSDTRLLLAAEQARTHAPPALAVVFAVLAVVAALVVGDTTSAPGTSSVSWLLFAGAVWLAMAIPVRARFGHHSVDTTAVDAVIAAGLWLVQPDELLLAVLLGTGVHLLAVRRQRGHVLLMNLSMMVLHTVLAIVVLDLLVAEPVTAEGPVALGATLVAIIGGVALSTMMLVLVAVLNEGEAALDTAYGVVVANLSVAVAAGVCGVLAADLLRQGRTSWWLPLAPLALVLVVSAAFNRERWHTLGLQGAIESTRTVYEASDPIAALRVMLHELGQRFEADGAELLRLPRGGGTPSRFESGDLTGAEAVFQKWTGQESEATLHPRSSGRQATSGWGMSMRVEVPDGDTVAVRLMRQPAAGRTFSRRDLELFESMCQATVISFETSQMHETLARLEEIDEMKTAFLTAVSHDLRTPLAVVLGGVQTLAHHQDRIPLERQHELLNRMAVQGSRLDRMLSDLLDIDRLQRGVIEPNREEVDVTAVATETVESIATSTHPVRISTHPVVGSVDRGHVSRIVENLVRNAIKYTPDGTPVWVDVRRDATGAQVIVSDAGPGIPEGQREAIFGAFVRGDQSHPSPGTGVGLDLVRRLAELHGGRAWADERPGGGARFWVTLPSSLQAARVTDTSRV